MLFWLNSIIWSLNFAENIYNKANKIPLLIANPAIQINHLISYLELRMNNKQITYFVFYFSHILNRQVWCMMGFLRKNNFNLFLLLMFRSILPIFISLKILQLNSFQILNTVPGPFRVGILYLDFASCILLPCCLLSNRLLCPLLYLYYFSLLQDLVYLLWGSWDPLTY